MTFLLGFGIFFVGFWFGFILAALGSAARIGDIELKYRMKIFEIDQIIENAKAKKEIQDVAQKSFN